MKGTTEAEREGRRSLQPKSTNGWSSPFKSYVALLLACFLCMGHWIILNTDEKKYSGQGIISIEQYLRRTINRRADSHRNCLEALLPSRTAQVYKLTRILRI
ncbi:hypothetical protein Ancab_004422 [Ancistrocladus abbreviatus]